MSEKLSNAARNQIKLQSKRNVELWIYSFADMYLILSVFFIVISVIYAAKVKKQQDNPPLATVASAGRGPSAVSSNLQIEFGAGSAALNEAAKENLSLLLPAVKSLKTGFLEVEGYADGGALAKGSRFSSNLDLSNQRAVRVAEWFMSNGVSPRNIRTFSYGDGHQWSKAQVNTNRRVLVKISNGPGSKSKE